MSPKPCRGYFIGRLLQVTGTMPAILLSSVAHALYKGTLFINEPRVSLVYLAVLIFLAGIKITLIRTRCRSLWPCIVFHMVFDAVVYGDQGTPWWIW